MKIKLLFLLLMLMSFCFAQGNIRYINVYGTAELEIQADMMINRFNIRIIKPTLVESKNFNKEIAEKLTNVLVTLGVEEKDIELSPLRFGKHYEYEDGKRVFKGYYAQNEVTVKLRVLNNYYELIDKVSKIESIEMSNSQFNISDKIKYNEKVNKEALLAAKRKAIYLAETMNVSLGEVLEIDEIERYGGALPRTVNYAEAQAGNGGINGSVIISKSIRVKFAINK